MTIFEIQQMVGNRRVLSIVGARPQFIKAAPVSLALKEAGIQEILVDTCQHYDANMRDVFFEQLSLSPPHYRLGIGSGTHAYQTGEAMIRLEPILEKEEPDIVLLYGDTNATLAGALTAAKLQFPIAHVEAGLRSFNRNMPEEINRVMTDHLSQWLFAPTQTAITNLAAEGITKNVYWSGDVMLDAVKLYGDVARNRDPDFLKTLNIEPQAYYLLTMHRAETTKHPDLIANLLKTIDKVGIPVIFPLHPRTEPIVRALGSFRHIQCIPPVDYFTMLFLEQSAALILTDSGGVQKEAAFAEVPCITLRNETEWTETVDSGWNRLVGLSADRLAEALETMAIAKLPITKQFGNGQACQHILAALQDALSQSKPSLAIF